ncbi:MAG: exonuclease domain-containing protein [Urechidicola sp.]|nr:exonuclease domain-containing protein [Urechidicola sp.]
MSKKQDKDKNICVNGTGTYTYFDGKKYNGEFKDGKFNGTGTFTFPIGDKYIGEFKDDEYNGVGILTFWDGQKYVGEFKDDKYNGAGIFIHPKRKKFIGEYKDGKINGAGIMTLKNGEKYVGEFKKGKSNGEGTMTFPDGRKYVGEFKKGLSNGTGTLTYPDGKKCVGEFKNGKYIERETFLIEKNKASLLNKDPYYLFFDTETTGLPLNWKAPVTDLNNWPRLVQLAYLIYDKNGLLISEGDFIIKPDGFSIPKDSSEIHGISNKEALLIGKDISSVLKDFSSLIEQVKYLVAHNISFDEKIIGSELIRNGMKNIIPSKNKICTMESTTVFCAINGPFGYKWPKLSELHFKLFGNHFEEAHNASIDVKATAKCFWKLREKGLI